MAGCKSNLNCTNLYASVTITVLPDIVGIGVLTSFLATATITVGTVLFGYFTDILPGRYLNWADWGFLQSWQLCKGCRVRTRAKSSTVASSSFPSCRHTSPEIDAQHRKNFNTFILALSDQQLVTGPAMIIAALAQRCQISCYEFQIVNSLAFLASTTHLASLLALREYFLLKTTARNIRVIGMIMNLALLMYTATVAARASAADPSVTVQCVIDNAPLDTKYIQIVIAFLILLVVYQEAISDLYTADTDSRHKESLRKYCCERSSGPQLGEEEFERWYEVEVRQARDRPRSNARREYLWKLAIPLPDTDIMKTNHKLYIIYAIFNDFQQSFMSEIPAILFSYSYGVTQVIVSRLNKPDIQGSENTVDFGQIIPLFLLSLPIFAMVEAYYESDSEPRENNKKTTGSNGFFKRKLNPDASNARRFRRTIHQDFATNNAQSEFRMDSILDYPTMSEASVEIQKVLPIPEASMAKLQGKPPDHESLNIVSGFVILENSSKAIAFDSRMMSIYSRRDVKEGLNIFFFLGVALSVSAGIMLWIFALYGLIWTLITLMGGLFRTMISVAFSTKVMGKVRKLKREPYEIRPFGGIRAPPPSIRDRQSADSQVENQALPESSDSRIEERDELEADPEIHAALPRQRQIFEALGDHTEVTVRRLSWTDTEANIGLRKSN